MGEVTEVVVALVKWPQEVGVEQGAVAEFGKGMGVAAEGLAGDKNLAHVGLDDLGHHHDGGDGNLIDSRWAGGCWGRGG